MPSCCIFITTGASSPEELFLIYPKLSPTQDPVEDTSVKLRAEQKDESKCSLGIPDTSFKGLRTRTARRVLRSTWVLKWVPAVARMLQTETQKGQGYHSLAVPSCSSGGAGRQQAQPGKHTKLMPAVCGRTWAWVNHQWCQAELNLAIWVSLCKEGKLTN